MTEEQRPQRQQDDEVPISTEVTALTALAFADLPSQAWAHIEVQGYLPHIVNALRDHLDGAPWDAVSYPETCEVIRRVIERLELEAMDDGRRPGGVPQWARRGRGHRGDAAIPVGSSPFPPPIAADDERAHERVELLTGRALTPAYTEGVIRLRQRIMVQKVEGIVGYWREGRIGAEEAMSRVADAITRPPAERPEPDTLRGSKGRARNERDER